MKKVAEFVKDIVDMLKRKTRAFKTRLVIFSLLHDRNMMVSSLSHKLKTKPTSRKLDGGGKDHEQDQNMVVVYSHNAMSSTPAASPKYVEYSEEEEKEKYPDPRHSLFEAEGSVIDMVKHSKEGKGEEFKLEDEIDKVADLFISRFHQQMWLQRQISLENIQDTP
ncbi:Cotton fiber protein [Hirschfeldia incana]|nr:Cotton fiber protein [Hirschfeldia incana]